MKLELTPIDEPSAVRAGFEIDGSGEVHHLLATVQGETARLNRESLKSRDGIGLPDGGRHILATDRPSIIQRQGQGRRLVGIRNRVLGPTCGVQRRKAAQVCSWVSTVHLE